ncbi:polyprenyl synthetase family protein [uncultured Actinomyces sp.]|uniref:polyprenyl synthetase family protein n=1 Tax=uncultured Actinomyces sp. TaxID=249061 RepID=UPI00288C3FE6|nr:polyprenyl synthetase family protein [uncultured Actinomyces sp.]
MTDSKFSLEALEEQVSSDLSRVEQLLTDSVKGSDDLIHELLSHLAKAGGKRLRPALTLICAHLGSEGQPASDQIVAAATAVELTHLATLYHDDVMDAAPQRRGVTATQLQWGNNRAILAGDVLFSRASLLVSKLGQRIIEYHAQTFERLCMGQLHETFGPGDADLVDFYIQVLADKTGSLIAASAVFGGWLSDADDALVDAVRVFGERVGVAFQIADDVIDFASDEALTGKSAGTDLVEGVVTMPVLLLRRRAEAGLLDEDGKKLLADIDDGDLTDDDLLASVVERLKHHEVLDETRVKAREWADLALEALEPIPDSPVKEALVQFANAAVDRMA